MNNSPISDAFKSADTGGRGKPDIQNHLKLHFIFTLWLLLFFLHHHTLGEKKNN